MVEIVGWKSGAREPPVVCQQPPVVRRAQFGNSGRARPRTREANVTVARDRRASTIAWSRRRRSDRQLCNLWMMEAVVSRSATAQVLDAW